MYTNNDCEISGISVCVPKKQIINNKFLKFKDKKEFIRHTGVNKHFLDLKRSISTSDLCLVASNNIIKKFIGVLTSSNYEEITDIVNR